MLTKMAEGYRASSDLQTYKASNDKLKKEVDRKEGVIVAQINKNKVCYALADSLQGLMRTKDEIIETQAKVIQKQGKVKRNSISFQAGWGMLIPTTGRAQTGFYAGFGYSRSLVRF